MALVTVNTVFSREQDTTDLRNFYPEEILLENSDTETEDSRLLDDLEKLRRDPLELNKVSYDDLLSIPFINSAAARNIIEYRNKNGPFRSKRQLLNAEGITDDLYEKIKIYIIVRKSAVDVIVDETGNIFRPRDLSVFEGIKAVVRSRFTQDLQTKAGYTNGKYEGTKPKLYNRLSSETERSGTLYRINLTLEKDPGEKYLNDFTSGFIEANNLWKFRKIAAGDFSLNYGQGLTLSGSGYFSKGTDAVSPLKRKGKGIRGYTSSAESEFFRGAAVSLDQKNFTFDMFYSDNYFDAGLDESTGRVSAFYNDGYHRTSAEMMRKRSVKEKLFGGRISYSKDFLRLGGTYWSGKFSRSVIKDTVKELYNFSGDRSGAAGADYDVLFKNMNFFGEWTYSYSGAVASINSVSFSFPGVAELVLSYRNYPNDFISVHSSAFGEKGGEAKNERGFYAGLTMRPFRGLVLNTYFDQYRFPYRTYLNPLPVSGNDFLFNADWKMYKGFILNLKIKNESKGEILTVKDSYQRDIKVTDKRNQLSSRIGFIYQLTESLRIRSRFEFVNVKYSEYGTGSRGSLFFSDLRLMPFRGLIFDIRIIFFDTENFDSRIYEYENDIKGVMSNTALYGKGRRWYTVLKYKPFPKFEISAKYSETFSDGVKMIGSGNDMIEGDINNKLNIGLEIGF